jgi:putative membrane-bound dehydrogenase-like protein
MIAGKPSHGFGSHEHYAGLRVLAETLQSANQAVDIKVVRGWPSDASLIDSADSIVIYSDGGGGHPALPHLEQLANHLDRGCGFVCIHYAVEVPKGDPGQAWLKYLGGYFETHWSVNPHWKADFKTLPKHPSTRGVNPFAIQDEWYFHMRFPEGMKGVTPILQAIAPEETMRRPDGPHSGNPDVRRSVGAGEPQTVAWTFDRPDGGRSFGFTGGHFHWNWGNKDFRQLVANAILWTAGAEVPSEGVGVKRLSVDDLLENQDFPKPENFDADAIARQHQLTMTINRPDQAPAAAKSSTPKAPAKKLFLSDVVTTKQPGHSIKIEADIKGVRDLFLVVTDGGDSFACDWASWINPQLEGPAGKLSLTEQPWVTATSGWGQVRKGANAEGRPISIANQLVSEPGIGTHANSVIHYQIPEGYEKFTALGALDSGGTNQNGGQATSVRFGIYANAAPNLEGLDQKAVTAQRDPDQAVSGLDVADGLEVTLSAHEPKIKSLTNLDIDDRGRVWVIDVMNYRRNNGSRPEGDRILILEDTTGDGVMDTEKVFYQGRDIDSAMGLCVLGNEVIVSAAPYIWRLIDDNGDDVADRKVAMFTQTGIPQHDHSNHSFVFGPDGKLYWNFGNTGQQVKDANGNIVVDIHGRPIIDNGKPFLGGMVFRCELDGSRMEVLAHNFRNNWETAIDSFGTLWQSDNDDDGNRGTRINFVMEHGNYGFRDEMTGATWQVERINMEREVPLRHWHLNDPGVVPNVLQTGAGSPSGMCIYEADLLPKRFHNQMIHCDPGPNVVRAYPVQSDGAGYIATIEPLVTGTKDNWFRPADVCVAPDGSLFVTDWYDPGVGGHRQEDIDRGRLFRIAPPGLTYSVPKFDYSTAEGAAEALRSPTMAVRYKAWTSLNKMGASAAAALEKLYADPNPRIRARALWLIGKIDGRGEETVRRALQDTDENIRITAIRLMRQLDLVPSIILANIADDPSPAVRREALVALRYDTSPQMPALWTRLANRYDGQDRWYLEALGIAADVRAQECYQAFLASVGEKWNQPAKADIVWRMRTPEAIEQIASLIADPENSLQDTDRYFRALDFHAPEKRSPILKAMFLTAKYATSANDEATRVRNDQILIRALERTIGNPGDHPPEVAQAIARHLQRLRGTPAFIKMVEKYGQDAAQEDLMAMALASENDSLSVDAIRLLIKNDAGKRLVVDSIGSMPEPQSSRLTRLLGLLATVPAIDILVGLVGDGEMPYPIRSVAVRGMSGNVAGAKKLLALAETGKLWPDTRLLAGGLLAKHENQEIRETALKTLPLPTQADSVPVPAIDELVRLAGDAQRGEVLFRGKATCSNCHVVNQFGKQVGPDLSEIGSKLSAEAMYVSILDPSAGISHNYETHIVLLDSGQVINGLLISQTDDQVILRTAEAIDRTIAAADIVDMKKSEKSIMPEGLHQTVDRQGLVDIVQYMTTLRKKD